MQRSTGRLIALRLLLLSVALAPGGLAGAQTAPAGSEPVLLSCADVATVDVFCTRDPQTLVIDERREDDPTSTFEVADLAAVRELGVTASARGEGIWVDTDALALAPGGTEARPWLKRIMCKALAVAACVDSPFVNTTCPYNEYASCMLQ